MNISKFLHRQISVARVYGIPVRIDYRWFFVFALMVWLIASNLQRGVAGQPVVDVMMAWVIGLVTSLAFFLCIFGHELAHALMARIEGIEIEEIVLHPFGGLARMRSEPDSPQAEFRIAMAGPVASFLFAVMAFGASRFAALSGYYGAASFFFFLFFGNLLLAVFNLFPGYPLDGGRVLRALLWRRSNNIAEATRIAGRCGQIIAMALIAFGIYIVWRDKFTGLWTVLVGLFLLDAATGVTRQSLDPKHATVADAMTAPFAIEPGILISHFVDVVLPLYRQTSFIVAEGGRLHGILALEDLKALPRERWRTLRARDVMRPVDPMLFVEPQTAMTRADELMQRNGIGSLAVVDGTGHLVGFLQRGIKKRRQR
jgi:Zn-dependent protease